MGSDGLGQQLYGEAVGLRLSLPASCKHLRRGCVLMPAVCRGFLLSPLHGPLTPTLPRLLRPEPRTAWGAPGDPGAERDTLCQGVHRPPAVPRRAAVSCRPGRRAGRCQIGIGPRALPRLPSVRTAAPPLTLHAQLWCVSMCAPSALRARLTAGPQRRLRPWRTWSRLCPFCPARRPAACECLPIGEA